MKCIECGAGWAKAHPLTGDILCRDCGDTLHPCLTLTEAKEKTVLLETELFKLRYEIMDRSGGGHYYLFLEREVDEAQRALPEKVRKRRENRRAAGHKAYVNGQRNKEVKFLLRLAEAVQTTRQTLPSGEKVTEQIALHQGKLKPVINYLLKTYTDYHKFCSNGSKQDLHQGIRARFTQVFADRYPQLADWCRAQIGSFKDGIGRLAAYEQEVLGGSGQGEQNENHI